MVNGTVLGMPADTALIIFFGISFIGAGILWYLDRWEKRKDQELDERKQSFDTDIYGQRTKIYMTKKEQDFRHSIGQPFGKDKTPQQYQNDIMEMKRLR